MVRWNYLTNPSWDTSLSGWTVTAPSGTIDVYNRETSPETPQAGSWYAYTRRTTAGQISIYPGLVSVTPGVGYTGSIHVNRDGTGLCYLDLDWYNSGSYLSSTTASFNPGDGVWHRFAVSGVAPANATHGRLFVRFPNMQAWFFVRFDGAMFERSPRAGYYFDGSTPGCEWYGTAHASLSRESDGWRRNLITNPSCEVSVAGYLVDGDCAPSAVGRSTTVPPPAGMGTAYAWSGASQVGNFRFYAPQVPVIPGTTYTFSASTRRNRESSEYPSVTTYIRWYRDDGSSYISSGTAKTFPGVDQWFRVSETATAPADAVSARGYTYWPEIGHSVAGGFADQVRVDGCLFEEATSAGTYYDGATSGAQWLGTAHGSVSITVANQAPTANAGANQTVDAGDTVNLLGGGSSDPDPGDTLDYTWSVVNAGGTGLTNADLTNRFGQWATFVAPNPTSGTSANITMRLTVEDDGGLTDTDDVVITVNRDMPPTANAGPDQAVDAGDTVNLNGASSSDDGTLSYAWTVQNAAGTGLANADLTNRLTATPSFTAPEPPDVETPANIVLRLTVTDDFGQVDTDDVTVTVSSLASVHRITGAGGVELAGDADYQFLEGNEVVGAGGIVVDGAADVLGTLSEVVTGDGGPVVGGEAAVLPTLSELVTGAGGFEVDGTGNPPQFITPHFPDTDAPQVETGGSGLVPPEFVTPHFPVTSTAHTELGGAGTYRFRAASVPADVVIEWDLDGDDHFTRPEEDITGYVVSVESQTGRDYPSQLTGRAGPGKLRVELQNNDNRFSHFNPDSPLNNNGMGLQVGSRIRLRTEEATNPDATRIAYDSFNRAPSSTLGTADSGHVWTSMNFGIAANRATPEISSLATVNVGSSTHFVQATFYNPGTGFNDGTGNSFGVIYRYTNDQNYGRMQYNVATERLEVIDRIAGTNYTRAFGYVEPYDGMVLSAYATGSTVRWYLDGVFMGDATTSISSGTRCGIYTFSLPAHAQPWVDDFVVFDKAATSSVGILWTGYVTNIAESVELGPKRRVVIDAEGPLAQAASTEVYPTSSAYGRMTGLAIGNTLARAGMLDPPGPLDYGDIYTGAFGYEKTSALEVCRDFEEAELGFLYETQEGRIGFDHRGRRSGRTSQAIFADYEGTQLGYHRLEPRDWRQQIVNRVEAGIAGTAPRGNQNYIWTNWAEPPSPLPFGVPANHNGVFWIRPSDAQTPITRGQLLIVMIAQPRPRVWDSGRGTALDASVFWEPKGWTVLDGEPTYRDDQKPGPQDETMPLRLYAKIAEGNETEPICFGYIRGDLNGDAWYGETYSELNRVPYVVSMYNVDNFFGDIKEGVKVSEIPQWRTGSDVTGVGAPTVFPDWGPEHPSLFITALNVMPNPIQPQISVPTMYPPDGYYQQEDVPVWRDRNGGSTSSNGLYCYLNWAERYGSTSVESPTRWRFASTIASTAHTLTPVTIAIRGKNGSPPIKNGHVTVTRDDEASQKKYRVIRTHREESNLFLGEPDAAVYADMVLDRYGNEKPIMALSFWAATTRAHRTQAVERRVGDRITVEADNATGINYSGDYFIESINHVITSGGKVWETTWELSPVD